MKVSVHSIQATLFEGEAEKLIARTSLGQITVLDHHVPMISSIVGPAIDLVSRDGKTTTIPLSEGFLEVRPESEIVILAY